MTVGREFHDGMRDLRRSFVGASEILLVDNHRVAPSGIAAEMRQVLAELELISYGSTASWNSAGGGGGSETGRPPGDDEPLHDEYRDEYAKCTSDEERAGVLARAREALVRVRVRQGTTVVEESASELDERIVGLLDQKWTVAEVAIALRCTETRVRRAVRATTTTAVLELAKDGVTVRGIAMRTGLSKSDVQRRLKEAA